MDLPPLYSQFGRLVRQHRERLGLTQDQLARRIGLTRTSVTNIERGRQKVLLHHLFLLAECLQTSPDALLPSVSGGGIEPQLEQKLGRHFTGAEKEWARRIVNSGSKGGASNASSTD